MVKENIGQAGGVEAGSGGHARGVRRGHLTHFQQEPERFPDICSFCFALRLHVSDLQR